jgi:hypothetical protein
MVTKKKIKPSPILHIKRPSTHGMWAVWPNGINIKCTEDDYDDALLGN